MKHNEIVKQQIRSETDHLQLKILRLKSELTRLKLLYENELREKDLQIEQLKSQNAKYGHDS